MWKLELRPRISFSVNICFEFVQCCVFAVWVESHSLAASLRASVEGQAAGRSLWERRPALHGQGHSY
jgi:hypothetical protein